MPYAGPALTSRTRYYWSVRVWDADGQGLRVERAVLVGDRSDGPVRLVRAVDRRARRADRRPRAGRRLLDLVPGGRPGRRRSRGDPLLPRPCRHPRRGDPRTPGHDRRRRLHRVRERRRRSRTPKRTGRRRTGAAPPSSTCPPTCRSGTSVIAVSATNATAAPAGLLGLLELTTADGVTRLRHRRRLEGRRRGARRGLAFRRFRRHLAGSRRRRSRSGVRALGQGDTVLIARRPAAP